MSKKNDIFIDTFALNYLLKEIPNALYEHFIKNRYRFILTSLQIVEVYNPHPIGNDRISKIVEFLSIVDFIIVDIQDVVLSEEQNYPNKIEFLPVRTSSQSIFNKYNKQAKIILLDELFRNGLPDYGVNLLEWVEDYKITKKTWEDSVNNILENVRVNDIKTEADFLEYLNVRLCPHFVEIREKIDDKCTLLNVDRKWTKKLTNLLEKHDSNRMEGINLTSLIFWYDYFRTGKKILGSDIGDIWYSIIFPYCKYAVVDNSRYDCLMKVAKNENEYRNLEIFNLEIYKQKVLEI